MKVFTDEFGFPVIELKLKFKGSDNGDKNLKTEATIRFTNITTWDESKGDLPTPDEIRESHFNRTNFIEKECRGVKIPSFKKNSLSNEFINKILGASIEDWTWRCVQFDGKLTLNSKGYLFDGVGIAIATSRGIGPTMPTDFINFYEEIPVNIENQDDACGKPIDFYRKKELKFSIMHEIDIDGKNVICTAVNQEDHYGSTVE